MNGITELRTREMRVRELRLILALDSVPDDAWVVLHFPDDPPADEDWARVRVVLYDAHDNSLDLYS